MKANNIYTKLDGDAVALDALDNEERKLLARLRRRARTRPDWDDFDNYWTQTVPAFYEARGLSPKRLAQTTLWQVAQDLSSRLGIVAGRVQPPGPLDDLEELVLFKFGSVRAFCAATGIPDKALAGFLAGRSDLSLRTLCAALERIGYRLRIKPSAAGEPAKNPRTKRSSRRPARSA
jgi:hypothetical protein